MDGILIDSGAFIALTERTDSHHVETSGIYEELVRRRLPLYTTNLVVAETCTFLLYHSPLGHRRATDFGRFVDQAGTPCFIGSEELLFASRQLRVVYSTPGIERAAWDIFARYDSTGFSFTDCVSFAVMQSLGIKKALTFDTHFDTVGFERL